MDVLAFLKKIYEFFKLLEQFSHLPIWAIIGITLLGFGIFAYLIGKVFETTVNIYLGKGWGDVLSYFTYRKFWGYISIHRFLNSINRTIQYSAYSYEGNVVYILGSNINFLLRDKKIGKELRKLSDHVNDGKVKVLFLTHKAIDDSCKRDIFLMFGRDSIRGTYSIDFTAITHLPSNKVGILEDSSGPNGFVAVNSLDLSRLIVDYFEISSSQRETPQ